MMVSRFEAARRFEPGLVRLANVAALSLSVPYVAITFFEGDVATLVAGVGIEPQEPLTTVDLPLDAAVVRTGDDGVVETLGPAEPRGYSAFADARSYAGTPLVGSDGVRFGTLAVRDRVPRVFLPAQLAVLRELATLVIEQMDVASRFAAADTVRRQLTTLVDASPIAISTCDLGGHVLTWSPATERLFGFSASDATGRLSPDFPGGRNNRDLRELLAVMRRGAAFFTQRSRRVRADGTYVEVRVSAAPLFAPDGAVNGFVSMAESVEERERAERRIRLLESVVVSSNNAVIVLTAEPRDDPTIVYVNDAFAQMYGYAPEAVANQSLRLLRAPEIDPATEERIATSRRLRSPFTIEVQHVRANGETFWCEASHAPVFNANGGCDNWVVVARDITERRRTERMQQIRSDLLELVATDAPLATIFEALVRTAEDLRPGFGATITLATDDGPTVAARGHCYGEHFARAGEAPALASAEHPATRALAGGRQVAYVNLEIAATRAPGALAACWSTPIRGGNEAVFGVFTMFARDAVAPTLFDLRLGTEFAQLASIAIDRRRDRQQLVFLAHHDALTKLPNRVLYESRARGRRPHGARHRRPRPFQSD
ncbi:MAG: hypothetical protein NVS1B2_01670 [Vulcanimicrobiaceae bacterium]